MIHSSEVLKVFLKNTYLLINNIFWYWTTQFHDLHQGIMFKQDILQSHNINKNLSEFHKAKFQDVYTQYIYNIYFFNENHFRMWLWYLSYHSQHFGSSQHLEWETPKEILRFWRKWCWWFNMEHSSQVRKAESWSTALLKPLSFCCAGAGMQKLISAQILNQNLSSHTI